MTQLLQGLHDELVPRDYAASTIRSYVQIVELTSPSGTVIACRKALPDRLGEQNGLS